MEHFYDHLKTFLIAVGWGDHKSRQWPVCALPGPGSHYTGLPFNMVRLYVGPEDPGTLIAGIDQALART